MEKQEQEQREQQEAIDGADVEAGSCDQGQPVNRNIEESNPFTPSHDNGLWLLPADDPTPGAERIVNWLAHEPTATDSRIQQTEEVQEEQEPPVVIGAEFEAPSSDQEQPADQDIEKSMAEVVLQTSRDPVPQATWVENGSAQEQRATDSQLQQGHAQGRAQAQIDAKATVTGRVAFTDCKPPLFHTNHATANAANENDDDGNKRVEDFLGVDPRIRQQLRQRRTVTRRAHDEASPCYSSYDTRSYRRPDSPLWHHTTAMQLRERRKILVAVRLYLTVAIAVSMSVVGFGISQSAERLLQWKIDTAVAYLQGEGNDGEDNDSDQSRSIIAFSFWLSMNCFFGLLATLPVIFWKPMSAGSGIAEAKAVLNGIIVKDCTAWSTAFCKATSVIFAMAASLPVGLEGPMIFAGLAIGDKACNTFLWLPENWRRKGNSKWASSLQAAQQVYQMDHQRRDLQAIGTACGVATAFSSPIGGVLFAMEEGCSYWSYDLAWRTFTAACVTAIFFYLWEFLLVRTSDKGSFLPNTIVSKFQGLPSEEPQNSAAVVAIWISFRMIDYLTFAGMGIAGGIMGACWCEANRYLAIQRAKWHDHNYFRLSKCLEVLFLVAISSSLFWWLPQIAKVCTPHPRYDNTTGIPNHFQTFGCPENEFNHLATLFWNPAGSVGLNLLFWESAEAFSASSCLIAGSVYLIVLLFLFGSSIGMGIFIPLLYAGACYGRALGVEVSASEVVNTYAIVGSVAMLAGVTRVFISLCVIMVTATGQPHLISPLMVTTIFARFAGHAVFGREGIYDIILQLRNIPFLEELPWSHIMYKGLKAKDVMSSLPATLEAEETVESLLKCLKRCNALHDIPVIDSTRGGALLGTISRSALLTILGQKKLFYKRGQSSHRALTYECLQRNQRNYDTPESLEESLSEEELDLTVDLSPYIGVAPSTLNLAGSAEQAYTIFRTMGLRNLIVVGLSGRPAGVITRSDLYMLEEDLEDEELGSNRKSKELPSSDNFSSMS